MGGKLYLFISILLLSSNTPRRFVQDVVGPEKTKFEPFLRFGVLIFFEDFHIVPEDDGGKLTTVAKTIDPDNGDVIDSQVLIGRDSSIFDSDEKAFYGISAVGGKYEFERSKVRK